MVTLLEHIHRCSVCDSRRYNLFLKKSKCAGLAREIGFFAPNSCSLPSMVKGAVRPNLLHCYSQGISPSFSRGWLCEYVFEIGDTQRLRSYYVFHWGVHHSLGEPSFCSSKKGLLFHLGRWMFQGEYEFLSRKLLCLVIMVPWMGYVSLRHKFGSSKSGEPIVKGCCRLCCI